jgi:hypothetical protein
MRLLRPFVMTLMMVCLTACANTGLRTVRSNGDGPDDFLVNPTKPLETPESYTALPNPTPGQVNRVDPTPVAAGTAALGGRRGDPNGAVPSLDGAVVQHASRFGVTQDVRGVLATEDAAFRTRKARFTQIRLVPVDRYGQAYKRLALDPDAVARQYRRSGIATPSAPPRN